MGINSSLGALNAIARQQKLLNMALPHKSMLNNIAMLEKVNRQPSIFNTLGIAKNSIYQQKTHKGLHGIPKVFLNQHTHSPKAIDFIQTYNKQESLLKSLTRGVGGFLVEHNRTVKAIDFIQEYNHQRKALVGLSGGMDRLLTQQKKSLGTVDFINTYNYKSNALRSVTGIMSGLLNHNNRFLNSTNIAYHELNTDIEQAISKFEKEAITEESIQNLYQAVSNSMLGFLNVKSIPRDIKLFIVGLIINAFSLYISYYISKQLSDTSTEQTITAVNSKGDEVISNVQSARNSMIDTIIKSNNKLVNSFDEPYVTVHTCIVYHRAKCRAAKNQIGEGTYVDVTDYTLGRKVFINYTTEDCPEEPQVGWIDKKYIKKETVKPKRSKKLYPIRKFE